MCDLVLILLVFSLCHSYFIFKNVEASLKKVKTRVNVFVFQNVFTMIYQRGMLNVNSNVPYVSIYLFHILVIIHYLRVFQGTILFYIKYLSKVSLIHTVRLDRFENVFYIVLNYSSCYRYL